MSSQAQQQQENKKGRAWWGVFSKRAQKPELEQEVPVLAQGTASDVMVVLQFRPAWEIQAYLRFARLSYRVENSSYMGSGSTDLYPALIDGQYILPGAEATLHVSKTRKDLDRNLTREEKAEAEAFAVLVREGLQPLLRAVPYRGGGNAARQMVRLPTERTLLWPLTWYSPAAEAKRIEKESLVRGYVGLEKSDLLARARALYSALDLRLGKQDAYFFGATPTSLDACVFGHLAEAWSVGDLLDLLPAFENLSSFFRHVCNEYFRPGSFEAPCGPAGHISDGGISEMKGDEHGSGAVVEPGAEGDGVEGVGGGGNGLRAGQRGGGDAAWRATMMRADYMNSCNAFNQLPGCALCAEAPYVGDPYPRKPLPNASIPRPVLAGEKTSDEVVVNKEEDETRDGRWAFAVGVYTLLFVVQSLWSNFTISFRDRSSGGEGEGNDGRQ